MQEENTENREEISARNALFNKKLVYAILYVISIGFSRSPVILTSTLYCQRGNRAVIQ